MGPISRYTGMAALMAAAIALPVLLSLPAGEAATPEPAACGAQSCPAGARLRAIYQGEPDSWPPAHIDEDIDYVELGALPEPGPAPDPALAALGEQLFHDPALSASGQISCANCHSPELGFTDRLRTSFGHDRARGRRNAPTLLDKAGQASFMWDGSAGSLAEQAVMPILNPDEMAADAFALMNRLNADTGYRDAFATSFGQDTVTLAMVGEALAAFEATLHRTTPFDRFMRGDHDRLSDQQILGLHLFRTTARCANCHMGPRLTDDEFHNIGLTYYGRQYEDLGRYTVTGDPADVGAFRTPSLRHVGETGPYMHNGLFPHLRGVVNIYAAGGPRPRPRPDQAGDPLFPKTSDLLHRLDLTPEERDALVAFLETL